MTRDDQPPEFALFIDAVQRRVDMCSTERLVFEPKGWQRTMRESVRTAVARLRAADDELLHAIYTSAIDESCDVENILLYNVGTGTFASACHIGIRIERCYLAPSESRGVLTGDYAHHHRYAIRSADATFEHWTPTSVLATWRNIKVARPTAETKPSAVWYAIRSSPSVHVSLPPETPVRFGVRLFVHAPVGHLLNVAALTKPLLDGLISAFHSHDGRDVDEISRRVGRALGVPEASVVEPLMSSTQAVLGIRRLLWLRGSGVQWNPMDDRCVAAEVTVRRSRGTDGYSLSGELFAVTERV